AQAGAAMDEVRIERFHEQLPWIDFIVMYGQTEASSRLTSRCVVANDVKKGSVGLPIPGVELSIRGEDGLELASGQTGEVWARGPNIMQQYWSDPDTTRQTLQMGWL